MAKEKELQDQTLKGLTKEAAATKLQELTDLGNKIKAILAVLPHRPDPLNNESYYDFERRFLQFYAGGEVPPDKISDASPIIGFIAQTRFAERQPECREGLAFYGVHNALRTQFGASRESTLLDKDGKRIKNAFEFALETFFPISRSGALSLGGSKYGAQNYFGPVIELGGRWATDRVPQLLDRRYYGGARLSFSPENVTDILVGRTESRPGARVELRGQGRVGTVKESPLLIGGVMNIGVKHRNEDAIRVYLLWRTNVSSLFGSVIPK
jgi:hypothetical protein